jgi:hypothetical protein
MVIAWSHVFWWVAAGVCSAVGLALLNEVHKTKSISGNLLFVMILAILCGWTGLGAFAMFIVIAVAVHWFATKGSNPIITWGKKNDPKETQNG